MKAAKQAGQVTLTPIRDGLLEAIRSKGLSSYELGRLTGLNDRGIRRFLKGERSITLPSADRLAAALGLRMVEGPTRKPRSQPSPSTPLVEFAPPTSAEAPPAPEAQGSLVS